MSNRVQSTDNYDLFKKITLNRDTVDGHVRNLVKAINEQGNISEISPVIVNEKMEVIDGQHRVLALEQVGLLVHYLVMDGTNINTVRQMNTLQRSWNAHDFAASFAAAGDTNYVRFLKLHEDYGFSFSILLSYINSKQQGMYKRFNSGELFLNEERDADVRAHLDLLEQAIEMVPRFKNHRPFALAFKQISLNPEYDHGRFMSKLKKYGEGILRNWSSTEEFLRGFEQIYNYKTSTNAVRLY